MYLLRLGGSGGMLPQDIVVCSEINSETRGIVLKMDPITGVCGLFHKHGGGGLQTPLVPCFLRQC